MKFTASATLFNFGDIEEASGQATSKSRMTSYRICFTHLFDLVFKLKVFKDAADLRASISGKHEPVVVGDDSYSGGLSSLRVASSDWIIWRTILIRGVENNGPNNFPP